MFKHPEFNRDLFENDIALVRLANPIVFNDRIQPICFSDGDYAEESIGKETILTGWV